jgi:Na+:H+ antiporter, NhaA family
MRDRIRATAIRPLQDFLHRETSSGFLLLAAAAFGLAIANSPLGDGYFNLLDRYLIDLNFDIWGLEIFLKLTVLKFINYLLMTFFFFVVGLEIKRELTTGHLATFKSAMAPFIAAVGGMAVPAVIYLAIAGDVEPNGWGVPVATDIALAVGVLTMLGSQVAPALRTFLLGLAVIDDIGAILIIAFVYTTGVNFSWLLAALLATLAIVLFKTIGANSTYIYIFIGALLWYSLYRSGVHPTLAGVVLGLLTPNIPKEHLHMKDVEDGSLSIIEWLEAKIHPWSSFVIVPIFAFANTGVAISSEMISDVWRSPVSWGIFLGLVIGKPLGVFAAVFAASKAKLCDFPTGATKSSLVATGSAAGIGFTVAIFIAQLAFKDSVLQDLAVIAVIIASVVSGCLSWLIFKVSSTR